MARLPRWGQGKRRLAREAGEPAAWRFQRLNLRALIMRLRRDRRIETGIAFEPLATASDRRQAKAVARGLVIRPQPRGGLERRLRGLAATRQAGPVFIVGCDIIGVMPHDIVAAARALPPRGLVFGPAPDGGFWLAGLSAQAQRHKRLFTAVRWSGPNALDDSIASAGGLKIAFAATKTDVDHLPELAIWRNSGAGRIVWSGRHSRC